MKNGVERADHYAIWSSFNVGNSDSFLSFKWNYYMCELVLFFFIVERFLHEPQVRFRLKIKLPYLITNLTPYLTYPLPLP